MSINYLVEDSLIPEDGSKKIINDFHDKTSDSSLDVLVYPDVHYKKGSRVANGMLTSSDNSIFPSMLGVANCGFTFGVLDNVSIDDRLLLEETFDKYSSVLKAYNHTRVYSNDEIRAIFSDYLAKAYNDEMYSNMFEFLDISSLSELNEIVDSVFTRKHFDLAAKTLGTLGGGNHFFELQYVEESYDPRYQSGEMVFILHSDSIAVGDQICIMFSNFSELGYLKGFKGNLKKLYHRLRQASYFLGKNKLVFKEPKAVLDLIYNKNDYRTISAETETGKALLKSFFLATIFGEMNRSIILEKYLEVAQTVLPKMNLNILGSHSHDSLNVESYDGKTRFVQRNGVQCVRNSPVYVLPGALGTESYLMSNPDNESAYFSANHGVGRFLDKHLAKSEFNSKDTEDELKKRNMKLYRVGKGNISEQNPNAFKDVFQVTEIMQNENLGSRIAKLRPIASLKG